MRTFSLLQREKKQSPFSLSTKKRNKTISLYTKSHIFCILFIENGCTFCIVCEGDFLFQIVFLVFQHFFVSFFLLQKIVRSLLTRLLKIFFLSIFFLLIKFAYFSFYFFVISVLAFALDY